MENRWKYMKIRKHTPSSTPQMSAQFNGTPTIHHYDTGSSNSPGLNFFEASGKMLADSIKFPVWCHDDLGTMRDHGCIVRSDIKPFHICWLYSFHFIPMGYKCQPIEKLPTLCLLYLHFCFVARGPSKKSLASLDGNTTLLKRKWTIQFQERGPFWTMNLGQVANVTFM